MRVLTVTNLYPPDVIGGYEIACEQMVGALRARGHQMHVLTTWPRRPVPEQDGVERTLRLTEWHMRRHGSAVSPDVELTMDAQGSVIDSSNVGALLRTLESFRPDIVYLWNCSFIGGLGIAGTLAHLQVPTVWHLMDAVPRSAATLGGITSLATTQLLSRRLRARYLLCSRRLLDEIEASGFEFADRATIVPNWVEPFPADRPRRWYPEAAAPLRIVAAGQLAPHKGLDLIVEAARRLVDRGHSAYRIDLFGGGMEDRYRRMILEVGLEDHVRLRGSLPHAELVERFWDYDVFLFPTWSREPFAFAPLEAAARGCVPIMSRDCGNAEWCVDAVHCIKVAPDARAISRALIGVIEQDVALQAIARRAKSVLRETFSVGRVADQVERAFGEARREPAVRPGSQDDTYNLARLAEHLILDWTEQVR
jgi:glycogen synthase